jgi:hypothetical protein
LETGATYCLPDAMFQKGTDLHVHAQKVMDAAGMQRSY